MNRVRGPAFPAVLYSAAPFLLGALRELRLRRLGMDVPVALGITGAFVASAWATMTGNGAVYYDSVTMFVALLLVARWVELRARQRAGEAIEAIAHDLPEAAARLTDYPQTTRAETVAANRLRCGDWISIATGAPIPADGDVVEGCSHVEEAVLTGESWPQAKAPGNTVLAGSINRESPLIVRVTASGAVLYSAISCSNWATVATSSTCGKASGWACSLHNRASPSITLRCNSACAARRCAKVVRNASKAARSGSANVPPTACQARSRSAT